MVRVLVTGGAGFIGSNYVHHALENHPDHEIVVLDKLTYAGNLDNLKDVMDKIEFIKGDICNTKDVEKAMKGTDFVVSFAAESITENTYVPINYYNGTRVVTFKELWGIESKHHKVSKTKRGEAIFLDVNKGLKALSFLNGGQWMPIRAITRHWYKGPIIRLKQKFGIIEATPNHSIYSSNADLSNPENNPEVFVIRNVNEHHKSYKNVERELLEFLAAYITEGNATFNKANGSYIVEIGQDNKAWLKRIGKIGKKIFKVNYNIVKGNHAYHIQFSNKSLFNFLIGTCGKYAYGKFFPYWIFDMKPELREFFWKKLLEGDGTKDGRYTTTSYKLANQIGLLLALQGKSFTVAERVFKNNKWKTSYDFRTGLTSHYGLNKKVKEKINYEGWVYDLEVEKTHNFVCGLGNILCHNTHVDRSIIGAKEFVMTEIFGVNTLLEVANRLGVKKFLLVSTDEVYGEIESGSFKETDPLNPRNPYAASKAGADLLALSFFNTYGSPVLITRTTNNFGPYQHPEKFIPRALTSTMQGKPIPIYGDGKQVRDWIFVQDNCAAIDLVLHRGNVGEVYNICAKNEKTNLEVASKLLELLGKPKELIKFVPDRPGHDRRYSLDSAKVHSLGWECKESFESGMQKTVQWYQKNEWWWKPLVGKIG